MSEILAKFYKAEIEQILKFGNTTYKHYPNQAWFIEYG